MAAPDDTSTAGHAILWLHSAERRSSLTLITGSALLNTAE
jgi:hypothetical protein